MESLEFSFESRQASLIRMRKEEFDFLIIGGGITGAATARDAASRGLSVALVEERDFAWGTSSRSSKLIHGGLRYLENMEFHLVFEALAERARLLKQSPLVRLLRFYMPLYKRDRHGRGLLGMGLWLYDFLSLFKTPGFHRFLSRKKILKEIPWLNEEGLKGSFSYFDASMWDDLITIETLRSAHQMEAAIVNYTKALSPIKKENHIVGFTVQDLENPSSDPISVYAKKVIVCVGPWTDLVAETLSPQWKKWLTPSKGIHLVFDLKKFPVPGAVVMSNPKDGRITFVVPRPDLGNGILIVGTTDGATSGDPTKTEIALSDVDYLMDLLTIYFPKARFQKEDILNAYVGVRPLVDPHLMASGRRNGVSLQKVSREHYISNGPGGSVIVAGGKYTTHRTMAEEIVDFALKDFKTTGKIKNSNTKGPINPKGLEEEVSKAKIEAKNKGWFVPDALWEHYGAEALDVARIHYNRITFMDHSEDKSPEGFPMLIAQLRFAIRNHMVVHLEDFYLRRLPLFLSRKDAGLSLAEKLAEVWAEERGLNQVEAKKEVERLKTEIEKRREWMKNVL